MKNLILHEIQQFLYGLRFPIALALVLLMFAVSSFVYINEYKEATQKYNELTANSEQQLRDYADNATTVATRQHSYQLSPRNNSFISDCDEMNMPNVLVYNAYYYIGLDSTGNQSNPFILPANRINWGFILLVLFSFLSILFSFDAISGEGEQRTLALCLSNPVRRSYILFSKYIAINTLLIIFALMGILLSLILLMISPAVIITGKTFIEIGIFLLFVVFFTGSMTAIGLFSSVMCRRSNVSLLISVSLWLLFLIAVPNFSQTIGMYLYPTEKRNVVQAKIDEKRKEIEAGFPEGKWHSENGNPFEPDHEIRANMMMAFAKNDADFKNEYRDKQFRQLEQTRRWTWISPLSVFEYGSEALLDGGYLRLRKNYNDLQNFKIQYLQWFKEVDAKDEQSPHWYNPSEGYSTTKKPVAYEEIPQFTERSTDMSERLSETLKYLMVMLAYTGVMFLATIARFERYDVK